MKKKTLSLKKSNNFQDLNVLVDLLVMKLQVKDEKGNLKKAKLEDKFELKRNADSNVIATISNKILAESSLEEAEKN